MGVTCQRYWFMISQENMISTTFDTRLVEESLIEIFNKLPTEFQNRKFIINVFHANARKLSTELEIYKASEGLLRVKDYSQRIQVLRAQLIEEKQVLKELLQQSRLAEEEMNVIRFMIRIDRRYINNLGSR